MTKQLTPLRVLSLCDGFATGYFVLKKLFPNRRIIYVSVEINGQARLVADTNFPGEIIREEDDVLAMESNFELLDNQFFDLFLCGFTCKSLSSQGNREGWDGESKIFFNCVEILHKCQKINPNIKFFFENVSTMENIFRDQISEILEVPCFIGDAGLVSPQGRVRYYWFNFYCPPFPPMTKERDKILDCRNFLDEDGLAVAAFTKSHRKFPDRSFVEGRLRKDNRFATLTCGDGCFGQSTANFVITNKMKTRRMSVNECKNAQGISEYDLNCISISAAFEGLGNGWQADAVLYILAFFKEEFEGDLL